MLLFSNQIADELNEFFKQEEGSLTVNDAYHRAVSQWHPDKLDSMAPELREYATRRTARINEAYQKVKSTTVQQGVGHQKKSNFSAEEVFN